jgi:eukaryotic-like serine/threonine-protein kinase
MIGQTISHYKILEKLGEGGMGVVYKAHDTKLDRNVALKFLPPAGGEEEEARFKREAQAIAQLDHPNICIVYEISDFEGMHYIAMAYIEGESLEEKIEKGSIPVNEVIGYAQQIVHGLQSAHRKNIIHRDVKSSNIIVTTDGQIKIMDFGLAKFAGRTQLTKGGSTLGTLLYMSPEQARGEDIDHRTDIWSFGVVLYQMITGRLPFTGHYSEAIIYQILNQEAEPVTSLSPNIPVGLEEIVKRCLKKNPLERYKNIDDTLVEFKKLEKEISSDKERISAGAGSKKQEIRTIGPYRLLEKLGEGGMGEVWVAEQQKPLRRTVALKLIKAGMDTRQVIARFESERQALALMDHPNIAKVFDAGETPEGRPYFVMEYVQGIPITVHCDRNHLSTRERLELFVQACKGVQHAHQKAIIHRDLKPSNILVAFQDGNAVPKIIDFGVAKATAHNLTDRTLYTELGMLIGTPEYMSPEQAEMSGQDIDTRTDIYSLGAILYELLTGTLPFDPRELRQAGFDEVRRRVRDVDPPKPSTRLSTMGEASTVSARNRRMDSISLIRQIKGDLDWITMKALDKDRTRRYGSPSEMAADIDRFLNHQPITARPPGTIYRAKKFVRRHRIGVAVATLLVVLLIAFSVTTAIQAIRIARERDRANQESETSHQVSEFLVGLFEVTDPVEGRGGDISAREILDRGSQKVATELREQPAIQATMLHTMGRVYRNLGLFDRALELAQESLDIRQRMFPEESEEIAASLSTLGVVKMDKGDYDAAESLMKRALDIQRKILSPENVDVAASLNNLGSLRLAAGDWKGAEQYFRESLALHRKIFGSESLETASTLNNLAIVLNYQERFEESEALNRESLAIRRKLLGGDHSLIAQSVNNMAMSYLRQKKHAQAEPMFQEALAINRKAVGEVHPVIASNLNNLALLYLDQGQSDKAEEYFRQVLSLHRKIHGDNHPQVAQSLQSLGAALLRGKRYKEAEESLRQAIAVKLMTFPATHWQVATTNNMLGGCLTEAEEYRAAESLLVESYNIIKKEFGLQHDRTRRAGARLIALYEATGRQEASAALKTELDIPVY